MDGNTVPDADPDTQREVVETFLAAAREGDFDRLVTVLDPRDGQPFSVGGVAVKGGRIVEIDILADPERLRRLDRTILDA